MRRCLRPPLGTGATRLCIALLISLLAVTSRATPGQSPVALADSETIVVPFTSLSGVLTALYYSGPISVTVMRYGQMFGTDYTDAFWTFTSNGSPLATPVRSPGDGVTINGKPIDSWLPSTPAYRSDHTYNFTINAPGGRLRFGISDTYVADNSGQYTVTLSGGMPPTATPTPTPVPVTFSVVSVRVDPLGANGGSIPQTNPLSTVTSDQTVLLSIYTQFRNLPFGFTADFRWKLARGAKLVFRSDQSRTLGPLDNGMVWTYVRFTPSHMGTFHLRGTVYAGDQDDYKDFTFQVVPKATPTPLVPTSTPVAPVELSFNSLGVLDSNGQPQSNFQPGQTLHTIIVYTIYNAPSPVEIVLEQSYQYWYAANRTWVDGPHPLWQDVTAGNGRHTLKVLYKIPTLSANVTAVQIQVMMSVNSWEHRRHVTIHIGH